MPATSLPLGWVIVYVPDVPAALDLYHRAFGHEIGFTAPDGSFGQLVTGSTALAFASDEIASRNLPDGFERPELSQRPGNVELAIVAEDVAQAVTDAVSAGCTLLAEPALKPHGQTVAYVRDPWGTLIELCTPIG